MYVFTLSFSAVKVGLLNTSIYENKLFRVVEIRYGKRHNTTPMKHYICFLFPVTFALLVLCDRIVIKIFEEIW